MKSITLILCFLLVASFAVAATGPEKPGAEAIIGFNAGVSNQARLTDPRNGRHYVAVLEPDLGAHGSIVVVDLVLTREGGSNQNLLTPFGIYHGLQPYDFAALDFTNGAEKSLFGRVRRIPIRRTATRLNVTIEDVQVHEVAGVPAGEGGSEEIMSLRAKVAFDEDRWHQTSAQGAEPRPGSLPCLMGAPSRKRPL